MRPHHGLGRRVRPSGKSIHANGKGDLVARTPSLIIGFRWPKQPLFAGKPDEHRLNATTRRLPPIPLRRLWRSCPHRADLHRLQRRDGRRNVGHVRSGGFHPYRTHQAAEGHRAGHRGNDERAGTRTGRAGSCGDGSGR
ncbi:hypothetical protein G6F50_013697 [Rhizopus delemar]|uniref:Uncharacterized protein n=1 Tax=Rhizopus delemar TaxID=936053 RepID=A0A9P6YE05_9FUNG|nr:hypothetical protein G6F50_013697 [Rhizopus delemar]